MKGVLATAIGPTDPAPALLDGGQDKHLKDVVAQGDATHEGALKEMKGRWKHPVSGMGWHRKAKRDFAALPAD
jgi:hypothetical protein